MRRTSPSASSADESGRSTPLGRNYWTYALLIFVSFAGSIGHVIAVTWLLLRGHAGPTYVSLEFMISSVPPLLLFRVVRRRASGRNLTGRLAQLDLMQAALALSVPVAAWCGLDVPRPVLLGQEFLLSCCGAFVFPLSRMLLVRVAPEGSALAANSASAAVFQIGNSVGAVEGGIVVATLGAYVAMAVNAGTFLLSAAGLFWLVVAREARDPVAGGVISGEAVSPATSKVMGRLGLLVIGTIAMLTVQRLFLGSIGPLVETHLKGNAALQGVLQMAFTIGGVAGGVAIARRWSRYPIRTTMMAMMALCGAAFIALGELEWLPLVFLACFAIGATVSLWSVFQTQAQGFGGGSQEADVLARIGLGQAAGALIVFALSAAGTLVVAPRVALMVLGVALVTCGAVCARGLGSTPRRDLGDDKAQSGDRVIGR